MAVELRTDINEKFEICLSSLCDNVFVLDDKFFTLIGVSDPYDYKTNNKLIDNTILLIKAQNKPFKYFTIFSDNGHENVPKYMIHKCASLITLIMHIDTPKIESIQADLISRYNQLYSEMQSLKNCFPTYTQVDTQL